MPISQLILAAFLGSLLGLQREVERKAAGLRTYALVSVGSCLFTILSMTAFGGPAFDPSRVAAQVVVGIGFIGAGIIFQRGAHVEGLTTAAGLWVAAAIGMAVGAGAFALAVTTTIIAYVLFVLGKADLENRVLRAVRGIHHDERNGRPRHEA